MLIESIHYRRECFMPRVCVDIALRFNSEVELDASRSVLYVEQVDIKRTLKRTDKQIEAILSAIADLNISLRGFQGNTGLDGETSSLTIKSGSDEVCLRWRCEPPSGWEALTSIADKLEQLTEPGDVEAKS